MSVRFSRWTWKDFLYIKLGGVAHAINVGTVAMTHFGPCSVITKKRKQKEKPRVAFVKWWLWRKKQGKVCPKAGNCTYYPNGKIHSIRRRLLIRKVRKTYPNWNGRRSQCTKLALHWKAFFPQKTKPQNHFNYFIILFISAWLSLDVRGQCWYKWESIEDSSNTVCFCSVVLVCELMSACV